MDKLRSVNQPPEQLRLPMSGLSIARTRELVRVVAQWSALAACLAGAAHAAEPAANSALERALAARGFRGGVVSMLVVDRASGVEVFARNPDALLAPASAQKVLTAVAALATFGPSHRFVTTVRASRPIGDDGAVGDLFVSGGDPALTSELWWRLAADLRVLGLRAVRGDLVLDDSLFDEQRWHPSWGPPSPRAFHAPVSALSANYGAYRVRVVPGAKPGAPLSVAIDPPVPYLRLVNQGATGKARSKRTLAVERAPGPGYESVVVTGHLPAGAEPEEVWRSVSDPLAYAASVLRVSLEANGITVTGQARRGAAAPGAATLLESEGQPLQQIATLFLKYSNNFIAECLLRWLALGPAPAATAPPASWAAGAEALRARLAGLGVPLGAARLLDGSGLSRENRISARILVETLRRGEALFDAGPELLGGLPLAGLDGTLRRRASGVRGRVRAKTGHLDGVSSLAGFARSDRGREFVFAVLANDLRQGDSAALAAMDGVAEALVRDE